MKIIEIGKCIDNRDPRGFGRIRAENFDEQNSSRANSVPEFKQWSKDDPFVYSPFLPNHINIIPKIHQAIKIIRYDNEKDLQNQEYIAGPFTTPHNFGGQVVDQQISETTLGQRSEKTPSIKAFAIDKKTFKDNFLRPESVGSIPKIEDIAISSNYGSDIILTEHGVQLRAGQLIDKNTANAEDTETLKKFPTFSKKHARLSLKKFPETFALGTKEIIDESVTRTDIKHLFEYEVDNPEEPTEVTYYIYEIKQSFGEKYKTDVFGVDTDLDTNTSSLIYNQTITLESPNKRLEAYVLIRDFISRMVREKLNVITSSLTDGYAHPFYFRPKKSFRTMPNSSDFLEKIFYYDKITYGLIFSPTSLNVPQNPVKKQVPDFKKISNVDQTFAAITADNILYLAQTNPGVDGKKIDFGSLDKYEYTQEDYIERIIPNTFSTVRGEKLIEILELITVILLNHKHGILTPPKYFASAIDTLKKLIDRAKQDMVNNSIRIN
jgi:hypothetical protein